MVCVLKKVEVLTLRQNLIPDMKPLSGLTTLRELDLYDNELKAIDGLEGMSSLTYVEGRRVGLGGGRELGGRTGLGRASSFPYHHLSPLFLPPSLSSFLDLSFNHIQVIEHLEGAASLQKLFLIQNKLTKIENLSCLTSLTMLELGSNRIRVRDQIFRPFVFSSKLISSCLTFVFPFFFPSLFPPFALPVSLLLLFPLLFFLPLSFPPFLPTSR